MTISYVKNCKLLNVAGYQKRLLPINLAALKTRTHQEMR